MFRFTILHVKKWRCSKQTDDGHKNFPDISITRGIHICIRKDCRVYMETRIELTQYPSKKFVY